MSSVLLAKGSVNHGPEILGVGALLLSSFNVFVAEILPFLRRVWNGPHLPWKREEEEVENEEEEKEEEEEEEEEAAEEAEEKEAEEAEEEEAGDDEEEAAEEEEEEAAEEEDEEAEEEEDNRNNGEVGELLKLGNRWRNGPTEGETMGRPTDWPWWRLMIYGPYSLMERPWNLFARSRSSVNKPRQFKLIYRRN